MSNLSTLSLLDILWFGFPLQEDPVIWKIDPVSETPNFASLEQTLLDSAEDYLGNDTSVILPLSVRLDSRLVLSQSIANSGISEYLAPTDDNRRSHEMVASLGYLHNLSNCGKYTN